jgi:hypothetical protein
MTGIQKRSEKYNGPKKLGIIFPTTSQATISKDITENQRD